MVKLLELLDIFIVFFKIGAFSFGGGYAMLPFIEKEVIQIKGWLTYREFLDLLAISQASPGPIAINGATFIGYKHHGISGSIVATTGVIIFSVICMNLISPTLEKYKDNEYLLKLFKSLKPITIGFIFSSAYSTYIKSIITINSFVIFILSLILLFTKKIHPILILIGFGIINIILKGA